MSVSLSGTDSLYLSSVSNSTASASADKISGKLSKMSESEATDEELLEACKEFETYMVEQVIKQTREAMLEDEDNQGDYMKYFGDTLNQEYAKILTDSGELGLAQQLYQAMKRQ